MSADGQEKAETPKSGKKDGKEAGKPVFASRMLGLSLIVLAGVFLPSTVVICVCMVPTFVAGIVDRHPQKTAWITVGAMNFAGALPAWFALWEQGHNLTAALGLITQPAVLLTAYGGAAMGWIVYNYVTPLVAGVVAGRNERRLKDIDRRHKELIRKWGEDVAGR